jgi:hypothetical protein
MQAHTGQAPWITTVVPILVIMVVMALRWRRMSRARALRIETLWILPAVYAAVVGLIFFSAPPTMAGWGWSVLALAIGAGLGWYRGGMMQIQVDPQTHALSQKASPAAFLLLIGLVAVRSALRVELVGGGGRGVAMLATDIAMAFALGLIATTRVEMALRARRLLADARAKGFA